MPREEHGRFDGILSFDDAEWLVCATGIRVPAFRLARDGAQIASGAYTEDIPWRPGRFSGIARPDRVAEEYAAGATIILQALHLHWHPAALYCRALEAALGWPVQANAYLTPATAQGFAVHHDTHDVFVLQVSGRKRWRLYEPAMELPLGAHRWAPDVHGVGEPVDQLTLEPGDTLFIPRGWPHEAVAAEVDSLHLTIGLHAPTALDALRDALDVCAADEVEFRRSLDPGGARPGRLLDRLAERLAPGEVARRARRRFVVTRRPVLDDHLATLRAIGRLDDDGQVMRRSTVIADLELSEGGALLRFEGKEVVFPRQARAAVSAAYSAEAPFSASDLPGPLDDAGRLVIVRRLVREGFLQPL
ncbi:MAG: cupin domain-containing protein [Solirubrobacteraceae bacterium]